MGDDSVIPIPLYFAEEEILEVQKQVENKLQGTIEEINRLNTQRKELFNAKARFEKILLTEFYITFYDKFGNIRVDFKDTGGVFEKEHIQTLFREFLDEKIERLSKSLLNL